jgi:hypothetical protein
MINQGIQVEACKECCDRAKVTDKLIKIGVNVRYMGEPFTGYIKSDEKILTI